MTVPDSLVARVYKARYFPKTSFYEATLGNCPSYCWLSIMEAHGLVCGGVRKRIGNGKTTLIWGSDEPSPLIQTAMVNELNGSLVSGLIDQETNTWDPHILSDIFYSQDVTRISRISINPDYDDSWFWYKDTRGCYSVKSGYMHIIGNYEDAPGGFGRWISVWELHVPPKWKTFFWRALNDILHTTINLIIKRVEVDPACPKCGLANENVMHALVLCEYSKHVWHESSISITNYAFLYQIWRTKNQSVWELSMPSPSAVSRRASTSLLSWRQVHSHPQQMPQTTVTPASSTRPKCFIDAGFKPATGKTSFSAVLLSHDGAFLAACNGLLADCFLPLMAESLACKEVLYPSSRIGVCWL
ncbi:PREDICTED: uncharacterized protein LOC109172495 [Ipomoea nil]|uniref:uncharacterized protein LOC109172495 n=1 Tax=Ipomoea nil TaxID=35883 RepID=UPI000901C67B|nr:PREDICTED: uncharacterized protein LOC109172495 [Ipomoea nil]